MNLPRALAATLAIGGFAGPVEVARTFVTAILAGGVLGAVSGVLGTIVLRRSPDDLSAVLTSLVAVFATSLLAEQVGGSSVIAVVVAGVLIGREMRARLEPSRVLALLGFWEVAAFGLNVALFLLVGMQLRSDLLLREAWPIGCSSSSSDVVITRATIDGGIHRTLFGPDIIRHRPVAPCSAHASKGRKLYDCENRARP